MILHWSRASGVRQIWKSGRLFSSILIVLGWKVWCSGGDVSRSLIYGFDFRRSEIVNHCCTLWS